MSEFGERNLILVALQLSITGLRMKAGDQKEALAIRRIFSLVDMIAKAKFSNSPHDFQIHLFG